MISDTSLTSAVMNNSDTTQGGFIGSRMYSTTLPSLLTPIRNAFGTTHISAMSIYYPNAFEGTTGKATGWKEYSVYITLPTECQIYGAPIWSDIGYEMGYETVQLAIFRYFKRINGTFWLRNVSKLGNYGQYFCRCNYFARADSTPASGSSGVWPLFNLI